MQPVLCIGQQIVMVADLDQDLRTSGIPEIISVPAGMNLRAISRTGFRDADLFPVEAAQSGYCIQIQMELQRPQSFHLFRVFLFLPHRVQPPCKQFIADKPFLSLAHDGADGLRKNMVTEKNVG